MQARSQYHLLLVPCLCLFFHVPAQALPLYTLTDLGTLGGNTSVAYNVNNNGEVVGSAAVNAGQTDPFYWKAGTGMVDLGGLGGTNGWAENIDNSGNIVGVGFLGGGNF